jgi:hypothetical protein
MSADDRDVRDEARELKIDLPVDDLNPTGLSPEAADKVKGGSVPLTPATPPGVPIPYPNTAAR